jgi:hypothetical protein
MASMISRNAMKSGNPRAYVETLLDVCREELTPAEFTAVQLWVSNYIESGLLVL